MEWERQDILRSVRTPLSVNIVNGLLAILTHPSHLIRRGAFLLLLSFIFYTFYTFHALRAYARVPLAAVSKVDLENAAAAAYVAAPPTLVQQNEYIRLFELIEAKSSAFTLSDFEDAALSSDSARVVGVTAVVLHWKRRKGLELVVKHISRYPYIREIIIWNNRPGIELWSEEFELSSPGGGLDPPILRIYNSPSNVHDAGKHFACSLASYQHCYFNDDDWLNVYMDALYTKYLECCAGGGGAGRGGSGGRIASNTMPIIHLEHRRWRFENSDIDLHAGFTWLGTGAFAPRHLSVRFLNQQSTAPVLLTRDQVLVSDMFFSLWANSYAEQMPNNLVTIDVEGGEIGWSRSHGVDQWAVVYANLLDAVRKLHDILLVKDTYLTPSPFPLAAPPPESHSRAPCADDGCLFSTSLTPFPPPSALVYPPVIPARPKWWKASQKLGLVEIEGRFDPWGIKHVHAHEERWNSVEGGWPSNDWWVEKGSWHLAVDGKGEETCWESWRAPDAADHFGLTLVAPRIVQTIKLTGSRDLENIVAWENTGAGHEAWEILTVADGSGSGWEARRPWSVPTVRTLGATRIEVTVVLEPLLDFQGQPIAVKKIKFVSRGKKRWKLVVCGFELDEWKI